MWQILAGEKCCCCASAAMHECLTKETPLDVEGMLLGAWVVIALRVLALNHGVRLPAFPSEVAAKTVQCLGDSDLDSAQGLLRSSS